MFKTTIKSKTFQLQSSSLFYRGLRGISSQAFSVFCPWSSVFPKIKSFIFLFFLTFLIFFQGNITAQESKTVVYLIPGQGADSRLYKNIKIDTVFETRNIEYFTPERGWSMTDFAKELSHQIDTSRSFILIGVSLGGMLATEMGDFMSPEKIILISSAKCRTEFPGRYRFQKKLPVYMLVPPAVVKMGALVLQPIVEPARERDKETFVSMLKDKDPKFLKRTVVMMMEWDRASYREDIIHIHGENDHTIPARNVKFNYLVEDGSHMMILTKADEMNTLLNNILLESTLPINQ